MEGVYFFIECQFWYRGCNPFPKILAFLSGNDMFLDVLRTDFVSFCKSFYEAVNVTELRLERYGIGLLN